MRGRREEALPVQPLGSHQFLVPLPSLPYVCLINALLPPTLGGGALGELCLGVLLGHWSKGNPCMHLSREEFTNSPLDC